MNDREVATRRYAATCNVGSARPCRLQLESQSSYPNRERQARPWPDRGQRGIGSQHFVILIRVLLGPHGHDQR